MTRVAGRGRESGVSVDQRFAQVWTLQDGAVTRIESYLNPAEALEAAGLSE
jgi:ketosteroid isomerase-like protein